MLDLEGEFERRVWRFGRAGGDEIGWLVQLAPGGKVINHDQANEASWLVRDGRLHFLDSAGRTTTLFDRVDDAGGRLTLTGRFLGAGPDGPLHVLTSWLPYDPAHPLVHSFHARSELSGACALVVTLNGRGRPFDGDRRRTEFEMPGLAPSLNADALLVAEAEQRCAWYADKADTVLEEVRGALRPRHRTVAIVGMSAGGYGAVLLADRLAAARPDLLVVSVAINAPTSLLRSDLEHVWRDVPSRFIPPSIAPDALAHCPPRDHDLRLVAQASHARHVFFFDSANPAETFFAERLRDVSSCVLVGLDLGLAHAAGCTALYQSRRPAALLRRVLDQPELTPDAIRARQGPNRPSAASSPPPADGRDGTVSPWRVAVSAQPGLTPGSPPH